MATETIHHTERERFERAVSMLSGQQVRRLRPGVWRVESQTFPGCFYIVRDDSGCACPDHTYRQTVCKHMAAVALVKAVRDGYRAGRLDLNGVSRL